MNRKQINSWFLAIAVLVISSPSLIFMAWIASGLPQTYTTEVSDFILRGRPNFPLEYDLPIYRIFIIINILLIPVAWMLGPLLMRAFEIARLNIRKVFPYLRFVLAAIAAVIIFKYSLFNWHLLQLGPQIVFSAQLEQLPYFWPLRYGAVLSFTFSFIIPVIYMMGLLGAIENIKNHRREIVWALLNAAGLFIFLIYVRYPVVNGYLPLTWPAVIVGARFLNQALFLKKLPSLETMVTSLVSVCCGIEASLLYIWRQETFHPSLSSISQFSLTVYALFIAASLIAYSLIVVFNKRLKNDVEWLASFAAGQIFLISLAAMALFKLIIYDYRGELARFWFSVLGLVMLAQPVVWHWCLKINRKIPVLQQRLNHLLGQWWPDIGVLIIIAAVVYIPDPEAVIAHIFFGEHLHHMDSFAMAPSWILSNGGILDVDARSQYGIGSVVVINALMNIQGGISYAHCMAALIVLCTIYFMVLYVFLRRWLPSRLLAMAAWCMIFKAHIAFELAFPLVFTYPQSTVVRQGVDILWMMSMLTFLNGGKGRWLVIASMIAGLALWYVPSVGFYLIIVNGVIALMAGLRQESWRAKIISSLGPSLIAVISAVIFLVLTCGMWFFRPEFWHNIIEFLHIVLVISTSPLSETIKNLPWDVMVFGSMVIVFVLTIVKVGLDYLSGKDDRRDWLALGLSVYGLGLLEHYVTLSAGNNYYSKSMPFFAVLFYWISKAIGMMSRQWQRRTVLTILAAALIAMVTNHSFMAYPGMLNLSANPLLDQKVARPLPDGRPYFFHKHRYLPPETRFAYNSLGQADDGFVTEFDFKTQRELVDYFRHETNFAKDAALIDRLTAPDDHVPLISSFEVMMLMQAKRKPFFYIFPFLDNRPMRIRSFGVDLLHTWGQIRDIIARFEAQKPPVVFIEKIMLANEGSPWYEENAPGLMEVLRYVKTHYQPQEQGEYLVAMHRKK